MIIGYYCILAINIIVVINSLKNIFDKENDNDKLLLCISYFGLLWGLFIIKEYIGFIF